MFKKLKQKISEEQAPPRGAGGRAAPFPPQVPRALGGRRCPSGRWGGSGGSPGPLAVSGRAPVASRPEGGVPGGAGPRFSRQGLGVPLTAGRPGPAGPAAGEGRAAQALVAGRGWASGQAPGPGSLPARGGFAVTSKDKFVVSEPPPVRAASAEVSERVLLFGHPTKAVFWRVVKTSSCSNIRRNVAELGFVCSV